MKWSEFTKAQIAFSPIITQDNEFDNSLIINRAFFRIIMGAGK